MAHRTRRRFLAGTAVSAGTLLAGCLDDSTARWTVDETLPVTSAVQYQGPSCDCCDVYADYLDDHLAGELRRTVVDDIQEVKSAYGIDRELRSCHTVVLDEYVVEGHVPVAAVVELLDELPEIEGIALPGMPAGSPGMGGEQSEPWTIRVLGDGSVYGEY